MKRIQKLIIAITIIISLLASGVPAFAFSPDESRSAGNFFIETGLLKGDGSGYGLENTASRLEGIILLIRLMGKEAEALGMNGLPCRFTDVPDWAKGYVNYADENGISRGVGDTRFGVTDKMTAEQYNTLLLRILGYDDSRGDFQWSRSLTKAIELSILSSDMAQGYIWDGSYTKGDLMDTSFCYLEADFKDQEQTLIGMLTETGVVSKELAEKYGLGVEGWDSVTTGFYEEDHLKFDISDDVLTVTGTSGNEGKTYLLIHIKDMDTGAEKAEKIGKIGAGGRYAISLSLARLSKGEYYVDVYGNSERYNYYTSVVLESLILKKTEDDLYFEASPVYGRNLRIFNGSQPAASDLTMTPSTRSSKESIAAISALAEEITGGLNRDYEKTRAIHDWVSKEIYYDRDYLNGKTKETNINSIAVLNNRYAVCSGYSNLTADLLVAVGIPNRQVMGYALGVTDEDSWEEVDLRNEEPNHVWNEVYIDGRWVIIDTTWDSANKYEEGKFNDGDVSMLFFDVTVPFLSNTHRIIIP
ncbi:MAG TPA: transglutaminase domain-containing protein [Anaerovoracaceae bacterium]|nr:transglutaminase domain-containing protein [Anaerovoracaceae bacterium]